MPEFKQWSWSALSGCLLAAALFAIVVGILGLIAFFKPKVAILTIFAILCFLSFLFTLAIAIFAIVAGSTNLINPYFGCNAKMNGIMEIWRGMDSYLINADRYLCSSACPCYITNAGMFTNNSTVLPFYNNWVKTTNPGGAVRFQDCPTNVKLAVYNAALADPFFNPQGDFVADKFWGYMAKWEEDFQCAGFCANNYLIPGTLNRQFIYKYMFTDINRGVPMYSGCVGRVLDWLPPLLLAFGAVGIVLAFFQLLALLAALALCKAKRGRSDHKDVVVVERREVAVERPVQV